LVRNTAKNNQKLSGILSTLSTRSECFAKSCRMSKACRSLYLEDRTASIRIYNVCWCSCSIHLQSLTAIYDE